VHPSKTDPDPGRLYAILVDVAGEDEAAAASPSLIEGDVPGAQPGLLGNPARDATALTVVEVDLATLEDELIQAPTYAVVSRSQWTGVKHAQLYGKIKALAQHWGARYLVIDATGVGAGLASFLDKALPGVVFPFTFSQASKSDLGWAFLSVIETGRYKEFDPIALPSPGPRSFCGVRGQVPRNEGGAGGEVESSPQDHLQSIFWTQVELCQSKILEGPGKLMQWGVPDGRRHPVTRRLVHDDLLVSASFCAVLDRLEWGLGRSTVIDPEDLFSDMHPVY
jgi:hypothetical protein